MTDVPGYKIGLHWYGDTVDPDQFDRMPNAHDEELIRVGLRKFFPDGNGPLLGLRTCLYDHTPDDVPIIDTHPDHDLVTLCGAGFKFVQAYAEAAAELAVTGTTTLPIWSTIWPKPSLDCLTERPLTTASIQLLPKPVSRVLNSSFASFWPLCTAGSGIEPGWLARYPFPAAAIPATALPSKRTLP